MTRIGAGELVAMSFGLNGFLIGVLLNVSVGDRGHVPFALPFALAIACGLAGHRLLARRRVPRT